MSVHTLKQAFLELDKIEQVDFGRFVLDNLFKVIEEQKSILSEEQQTEIDRRYINLKNGTDKGVSLEDFKTQMNTKYGI